MAPRKPEALGFAQQVGPRLYYSINASGGGLYASLGTQAVPIPWQDVQRLDFDRVDAAAFPVGIVRLEALGGAKLAWTDPALFLVDERQIAHPPVPPELNRTVVWPDGSATPLLALPGGMLLTAIVVERASLVEQADGSFARPAEPAAAPAPTAVHVAPEELLPPRSVRSKRVVQVLLLAAGLVAFSLMFSLEFAGALLAYLLIHEYGHVVAMKGCGVRVRGIFILPFLGAAAVAEDEASTRWREFLISLMGPVFGVALTLAVIVVILATGRHYPLWGRAALWYAILNLFNLLPLGILDGGRIVTSIAYSTHRAVGTLATFATAVLSAVAAVALGSWLLGLVAAFAFQEMWTGRRIERANLALLGTGCTPAGLRRALAAVWERIGRLASPGDGVREQKARRIVSLLKVYRRFFRGNVTATGMSGAQIAAAIALYGGLIVFSAALIVAAALIMPERSP
jgi:Zn-dependent protease